MVARLDLSTVSLAQKPKSAGGICISCRLTQWCNFNIRTNLDAAMGVQKDIIAFDIAMDDFLAVKMCQAFTRLLIS